MKTENILAAYLCIPVFLSAQADLPDLEIEKEFSDSQESVILLAEADARTAKPEAEIEEDPFDDPFDTPSEEEQEGIADPIEKVNRKLFAFNDKLYFWVLKPVSTGYRKVLPQKVRVCLRKAFTNLTGGVRIANNLLTGRLKEAGAETTRVVVNSTIGVAGLFDPAVRFGLKQQNANLDQTLGFYGIGTGAYIVWPVIGPSSLRGTVGYAGDAFLHPIPYLLPSLPSLGMNVSDRVNTTSLRLGEYEEFVKSALDPYLAARDAYYQYQKSRVMVLKDRARGE
ncbi:MAG: VacJ family lipoprotein [Planctomycetota bacterium]|jgi:phospholipid-binding lipoprotein MlaA|nr:VacJ family lipoprotein [Planctomycetota bacterium]MDP6503869.1 VacJ family lipoprotein [Planctomycetota bacterium]